MGSRFPSLSIGCLDIYGNQIPFKSVPEITVRLDSIMGVLAEIDKFKKGLSSDKLALKVQVFFNRGPFVDVGVFFFLRENVPLTQSCLIWIFLKKIQNMLIVSDKLDRIRPEYEATLVICPVDGLVSVSIPCQGTSIHM